MVFISESRHVTMILEAMRHMENVTRVNDNQCIQFRPRLDTDSIYIIITNGTGCSAYVYIIKSFESNLKEYNFFFFLIFLGWIP